jgi:hypothetical protein
MDNKQAVKAIMDNLLRERFSRLRVEELEEGWTILLGKHHQYSPSFRDPHCLLAWLQGYLAALKRMYVSHIRHIRRRK